jgi:hypothetical protein
MLAIISATIVPLMKIDPIKISIQGLMIRGFLEKVAKK